jgi:uncharacterized protein YecT (DUF1311 family)
MLKSVSVTHQSHPQKPLKWHALCPNNPYAFNKRTTMKTLSRYSVLACIALLLANLGCNDTKKKPAVANVAQDTMLLHDLAEANKNTAAAAAVDNSLNTVKTTGDQTPTQTPTPTQSGSVTTPTPVSRVIPRAAANTNGGLVSASATTDTSIVRVGARQAARTRPKPPSSGDPCDSPDPVDQRSCLNRSIVANDADLNQTYQELLAQSLKSGGSGLQDRFRQSQREWINTRDSECQGTGDGALWARARARCLAEYSNKRTAELQRSLNSLRGQQ